MDEFENIHSALIESLEKVCQNGQYTMVKFLWSQFKPFLENTFNNPAKAAQAQGEYEDIDKVELLSKALLL